VRQDGGGVREAGRPMEVCEKWSGIEETFFNVEPISLTQIVSDGRVAGVLKMEI